MEPAHPPQPQDPADPRWRAARAQGARIPPNGRWRAPRRGSTMGAIVKRQMEGSMVDWLMQRSATDRRRRRAARKGARTASCAPDAAGGPAPEDGPCGCGWFDSSHDLRAGLVVREHASEDAASESVGPAR